MVVLWQDEDLGFLMMTICPPGLILDMCFMVLLTLLK